MQVFLFWSHSSLFCLEGLLNISNFPSGVGAVLLNLTKSMRQNTEHHKGEFQNI